MNIKTLFFLFLVLTLAFSCNSKDEKSQYKQITYYAVNGKDTAILAININDKRFYGRYEIVYHKIGKDSGDVRGDIKGDTLRGDFHYISNGGSWKRIPLALLKKENKLFLGSGVIGIYFNLPCFMPGTPIEYNNSKFVFEEVKK
ncbi:hypothetical protein B0A67_16150 [Flavobacterium aquidurense]|jgi:hypothetical protein|uniref:hypothetical protein n=1 Tax=Flavobacterium aquidurense TaxID=362413 RepID=UPI000919797F|nr:hypothetical protein [Flavobacterium aquidurense]OXA70377.1 hypothetical protein B0A67_16150 [Flavobacterium aquidurense]SHH32806.1 hypothetical protein SAMN05444481_11536 [Flavobacterium frigidimaris]